MTYPGIFITLAFLMILITFFTSLIYSVINRNSKNRESENPGDSSGSLKKSCSGETLQGLL